MQYNKWEADGSICVQDSLSEVEPDLELEPELELELELELEDAHDSRVVRESLSESDTMPCGSKKLAAPSLYGWSVDSVRVFCRCERLFFLLARLRLSFLQDWRRRRVRAQLEATSSYG